MGFSPWGQDSGGHRAEQQRTASEMMTTIAVIVGIGLLLLGAGLWFLKRKLGQMGQHLPAAMERWEEEIKNLEKPKG